MRARSPSAVSCPCNPWRSSRLRISRRSQDSLIGLEREDVIGLLVDDFPSDASLTPHRVCGDDRALDRHHVERGGDGDDLIRVFRHHELHHVDGTILQ
jgi:hypothetical protein